jgi:cobalt/nickel transport system ATP-binding protein
MTAGTTLINLKGVSFGYPGGQPVLRDLDFSLNSGDRVGIIAPNGSGKTTLFHLIMGLLKPLSGRIEIFGRHVREENDFTEVRRRIGLLFQDADDQLFSPTVLEDVAFGPLNLGKPKDEAIAVARRTLAFLGLDGFEDRSRAARSALSLWRRFSPWNPRCCCWTSPATGSMPGRGPR